DAVDRIGAFGGALVEMRADGAREVPAGGESEHANARRVDVPFGRSGADGADSPLAVQHWHWVHVARAVHAVLKNKRRDTEGIEPVANIESFVTHSEAGIATAGKNKDGRRGDGTTRPFHVQ